MRPRLYSLFASAVCLWYALANHYGWSLIHQTPFLGTRSGRPTLAHK